jgi:TonB family protein
MCSSVALHGLLIGGVIALTGVSATVVLPEDQTPLTFAFLTPPPPPPERIAIRVTPPRVEQIRLRETPPEIAVPAPPPEPEPEAVVERPQPEPVRPEPVVERPRPTPTVTVGAFDTAAAVRTNENTRSVQRTDFDNAAARPTESAARQIQQGGFDNAAGKSQTANLAITAVGGFEQTAAQGLRGSRGNNVVGDAGFGGGNASGPARGGGGRGTVTSGGFDTAAGGGGGRGGQPARQVASTDFDTRAAAPQATQQVQQAPAQTPVEILSKPVPAYTDDARAQRIEGEVVVEVEFAATGEIRVLRVVRGLGHGLDESAMRAVRAMRFKPAQRNGEPVDFRTTLNIVFRLA